jgi:signal transduction histidine kinase
VTLAKRLFAGYVLLITVLVFLVVALSGERLRSALEKSEIDRLGREARFIAAQWTPSADPDALAHTAGATLGHRVTLIDPAGHVIGDSEFERAALPNLQNHNGRPEVIAARRGEIGVSHRISPSRGDDEFYVAVPAALGVARVSMNTGQLASIVRSARRDVLLSGAIALAAALLLSMAFAHRVSRPIVELRDVARALAAGDLARRPALSSAGEVGELGTAVHRMAEQLAGRLKALQMEEALLGAVIESLHEGVIAVDSRRSVVRLNDSARRLLRLDEAVPFPADHLPRDSALRGALDAALAGRAAEPEEIAVHGRTLALTARPLGDGGAVLALFDLTDTRRLEAVRRDFVANVSHELKTPLTVIGGFAETLATDDLSTEQRARFVATIRSNTERMRRIVDDLLDLSRIESGGWRPVPTTVDARVAADEVLSAARRLADEKQVTLAAAIAPDALTVYADPTAVRQVLSNLVDNAVRYTPAGGTVTIFTRRTQDGDAVWLGVRDTGIGIAAEHLPRIFERFYRADPARSREAGGTGLGLAIVRHLVEAHGGRVDAASEVGRGTVISALFPAARYHNVTNPPAAV